MSPYPLDTLLYSRPKYYLAFLKIVYKSRTATPADGLFTVSTIRSKCIIKYIIIYFIM